jgi:hypothetical protein
MDLIITGLESVDWIHMALERNQWLPVVNMVMNLLIS